MEPRRIAAACLAVLFCLPVAPSMSARAAGAREALVRYTPGDGFRVLTSRALDGAIPGQRAGVEADLLVEALSDDARVVDRRAIADPTMVRTEWPDETGLLSGAVLASPATTFRIAFRDDPQAATLRFSRRAADGSFEVLGTAPIRTAPIRTAPTRMAELPAPAPGAVTTVANNGASANRVDLVVIAEGYTEQQQDDFSDDAATFVAGVFDQEPFREYTRFFNVHELFVPSAESGADHPEDLPPVYRDTAFDATYNCQNIERLICVDTNAVMLALWSTLEADQLDMILVLVNDPEYGGSGGLIGVSSVHEAGVEIVLHELGHSFGLLADEYTDQPPLCSPIFESQAVNATREFLRDRIKWRHWIDPSTPIPTLENRGAPGAYIGADYCPVGKYRPTFDSKMRSLDRPFEPINTEQLVRRTYAFVSPIDSASPPPGPLPMHAAQTITFSIATPQPATHDILVEWILDGEPIATGSGLTFAAGELGPGEHELLARASDPTPFVRHDPNRLLQASVGWSLTVTSS